MLYEVITEQRYIIPTQPATEEWTKCHLTFTPQETGNIKLMLMSSKKDIAVCYDDLTVITSYSIHYTKLYEHTQ